MCIAEGLTPPLQEALLQLQIKKKIIIFMKKA